MEFLFHNARVVRTRDTRYLAGQCDWQHERVGAFAFMATPEDESKLHDGEVRIFGEVEVFVPGAGLMLQRCLVIESAEESALANSPIGRTLEPEVMDSDEDSRQYNAMDHSEVNARFVNDLLFVLNDKSYGLSRLSGRTALSVLDLGTGTAQIPIKLARSKLGVQIIAIDAAESMLALASKNIEAAGLSGSIGLVLTDSKALPFCSESFSVVISNSIVHHIPSPKTVISEAIRVAERGGLLFHRDLCRPRNELELRRLVKSYAGGATDYQRKLFADSLRAALTVDEIRSTVADFGFAPESVQMTSDRHWTWTAAKN